MNINLPDDEREKKQQDFQSLEMDKIPATTK